MPSKDAIAIEKTVIKNGNLGVRLIDELAVEVDFEVLHGLNYAATTGIGLRKAGGVLKLVFDFHLSLHDGDKGKDFSIPLKLITKCVGSLIFVLGVGLVAACGFELIKNVMERGLSMALFVAAPLSLAIPGVMAYLGWRMSRNWDHLIVAEYASIQSLFTAFAVGGACKFFWLRGGSPDGIGVVVGTLVFLFIARPLKEFLLRVLNFPPEHSRRSVEMNREWQVAGTPCVRTTQATRRGRSGTPSLLEQLLSRLRILAHPGEALLERSGVDFEFVAVGIEEVIRLAEALVVLPLLRVVGDEPGLQAGELLRRHGEGEVGIGRVVGHFARARVGYQANPEIAVGQLGAVVSQRTTGCRPTTST